MLVLSRKRGEQVVIGDEVRVEIIEVKGNTVKVGVSAPSHVSIDRSEVWLRKEREKSHTE